MDKVQFNTEVMNMRKLVKRVKVLIVHSLTRQVSRLRKKKGSEQQVSKNQRRVTRLVAEIEAAKELQPDFVTKKAVIHKRSLQDVVNNPKSSAQDRILARVIHHKLIQERVSRFKGMVTRDMLRTGAKKYRRLRKAQSEANADTRLKEEEDYQTTLEEMLRIDQDEEEAEAEDEQEGEDDDDSSDDNSDIADESSHGDNDDDAESIDEDGKVLHKEAEYNNSSESDDGFFQRDSKEEPHEDRFNPSLLQTEGRLEGAVNERTDQSEDDMKPPADSHSDKSDGDVPETREMAENKMDSIFLGDLTVLEDEELSVASLTRRNDQPKQKTKGTQLQKKQPETRTAQHRSNEPTKRAAPARKVPMVDQPNPLRKTPVEKLIPGINCHPDLPLRHSQRDSREKTSRKPFPVRPQSKQFPSRPPANQSRPGYPTAATKEPIKPPADKEILHPSWEASKKRKEESKIVPFQGKKITFDDD